MIYYTTEDNIKLNLG